MRKLIDLQVKVKSDGFSLTLSTNQRPQEATSGAHNRCIKHTDRERCGAEAVR